MSHHLPHRRTALGALGAGLAGSLTLPALADDASKAKGNIKQSICRWCYGGTKLETLCAIAKKLGYQSIELLDPPEILKVKEAGLTCAVVQGTGINPGLNRKEHHDRIVKTTMERIEFAAAEKLPNVICMSGNVHDSKRRKIDDETGMNNCVIGIKRMIGLAEKKKVTLIMEGLNSKVNHQDYMYDRTAWGVELCKRVGSENFKLLYDIYHMQIMEGDVIRTIRDNHKYIGHYHTGGNPGRNEIDETQELNYAAIVKAIIATGYQGYLGQEFLPKRDAAASLAQAFRICDV
jgi:hydroxypyruvate isomerase